MDKPAIDLHQVESERAYLYADGVELLIGEPVYLWITENGSHRVQDAYGRVYRPTPGYIGIRWMPKDICKPFVA